MSEAINLSTKVLKVHEDLGLVLGYAIVSKEAGEDYFDLQDDNITDAAILKASLDFAENSRVAKEMHDGEEQGSVPLIWPMTAEIATAFGIEIQKTGLMIAMRPSADMLSKFKSGELTGFSIGGLILESEEVN